MAWGELMCGAAVLCSGSSRCEEGAGAWWADRAGQDAVKFYLRSEGDRVISTINESKLFTSVCETMKTNLEEV